MSVAFRLTVPDLEKQIKTGGVFTMRCDLWRNFDHPLFGASFEIRAVIDGSETNRMYKKTCKWGADDTIFLNGTHRDNPIVVSLNSYPKIPVYVDFFRIDMFCAY